MQNIKQRLEKRVKSNYTLYSLANWALRLKTQLKGGIKVVNHGNGSFKKDVIGRGNIVMIGKETMIHKSRIRIRGNNNKIIIGDCCKIRKNCSFWIQGNNCSIILGNNITMQHSNHFNAQEDGRSITIGNNCMFSNNIIVRTSDAHGIFDIDSKQRLNEAKDVTIGNHVWIAPNSRIMKGAVIEDGAVIGSNTMVSKHIPANCLAVGMPARVVKENIVWSSTFFIDNNNEI